LGKDILKRNDKCFWSPDSDQNGHLMITGASGSGKSTLLDVVLKFLKQRGKTVHLIDYHGNIQVEGETSFKFNARNSPYGINPFEFLLDKANGGINIQAKEIIDMIKKSFLPNMGAFQESVLKRLIIDTYLTKGFKDEDTNTWGFNFDIKTREGKKKWSDKLPSMEDMLVLINSIKDISSNGLEVDFSKEIAKHGKKLSSWKQDIDRLKYEIDQLAKNANIGNELEIENEIAVKRVQINDIRKTIGSKKEDLLSYFDGYLDYTYLGGNMPTFQKLTQTDKQEIDFSFYRNPKVLKSLEELKIYIGNLVESGAFSKNVPNITQGVNRYDLKGLSAESQAFFTDVLVTKLFKAAQIRGDYFNLSQNYRDKKGNKTDMYVVIDEAKITLPQKGNRESIKHPINRVVAEARKYGFGIILISQVITDFSNTILSSITNKIVLTTNGNDRDKTRKILGVKDTNVFTELETFGIALTNVNGKGYRTTYLPYFKEN
jgi:energy-coupling factor transporter ATP-binding protein EcfA2